MHPDTITIPLTQGKQTIIDAADYPLIAGISWSAHRAKKTWYAMGNRRDETGTWRTVMMHRLIMGDPPDLFIDHWDRDGLNNRRANLRPCTSKENPANRVGVEGTTSKYKGVYRKGVRWITTIQHRTIGRYDTEEQAARAYDTAARETFGEFCLLNFPGETERVESTIGQPRGGRKYRGITYRADLGKWAASIMDGKKRHHLGYYTNPVDAALAYDAKARELRGPNARLNFPEDD